MVAIFGIVLGSGSVNAGSSAGVGIGTTIQEFINLAVDTNALAMRDGNGNASITPDPSGTLISGDVNVAVTTNTAQGFSLSVYTQDATTSMTHNSSTVTDSISSIDTTTGYDAATGASALSADTWGFRKKTGTTESPVYGNWFGVGADETHGTVIEETNSANSEYCATLSFPLEDSGCANGTYTKHTLNFGANVTSALKSGIYTNNVVISAIAKSEGKKYIVNFNSNGANNSLPSRAIIKDSTFTIPAIAPVSSPYTFVGYAFSSTANTADYTPGQSVNVNDFLTAAASAGQDINEGITLYMIWQVPYTLTYNAGSNGEHIASGDAISSSTDLFSSTTIASDDDDHFTLEDYNFLGWALTDGATDVVYEASDTVSIRDLIAAAATAGQSVTSTTSGTINLYAVWEEGTVWMQTFDCNTRLPNIGDSLVAVDNRDNHEYHVKKLSDGNCWMIDNLTISATGMVADSLDNTNTNIPSSDTNKYYLPPQNARYTSGNSITNSSVKTANTAVNFDTSYSNQPQVGYRAKNTTDNNTGNPVPENTAYYNFYTASLGFSYYNDGKTSGSTPRDICPKGWRLPWVSDSGSTSTGTGDMYTLALSYNNNSNVWSNYITPGSSSSNFPSTSNATVRQNMVAGDSGSLDRFASNGAAGFTYAGYYDGTTLYLVGARGLYWSSSVYDTGNSYYLNFVTADVSLQNGYGKYYGFAVRCVAIENVTVNYDANGGTGTVISTTSTDNKPSTQITLPNNTYTKTDYIFAGWSQEF